MTETTMSPEQRLLDEARDNVKMLSRALSAAAASDPTNDVRRVEMIFQKAEQLVVLAEEVLGQPRADQSAAYVVSTTGQSRVVSEQEAVAHFMAQRIELGNQAHLLRLRIQVALLERISRAVAEGPGSLSWPAQEVIKLYETISSEVQHF